MAMLVIILIQLSNWWCVDTRYKAQVTTNAAASVARAIRDACRDHQASEKVSKAASSMLSMHF